MAGGGVRIHRTRSSTEPRQREVEALQLARRTEKSLLIVDDRLARREAMRYGLDFIGTVRVLHLAERRSIINDDDPRATVACDRVQYRLDTSVTVCFHSLARAITSRG